MKHNKKNRTVKRKRGGTDEPMTIEELNDDPMVELNDNPIVESNDDLIVEDNFDVDGGPMMPDELNVEDNVEYDGETDVENADSQPDTEMFGGGKKNKTQKRGEQLRSRDLKYCPHMPLDNGKYAEIDKSKPLTLKWKGKKYRFYTCCQMCSKRMLELAKTNPKKFERTYIYKIEKRDMYLKHKETQKLVQIAKEIGGKTKKKTKNKTKKKNKKTRKKMKGGNQMFGRGYGANCNDPNFSITNTNLLKLFPYKPT